MLQTPVALVLFRRPETTRQVFEAIAGARPRRLFLIADAPRPGVAGEAEACEVARQVVERIDWDCEVTRDYAETNLGCGQRPATGIDAVFRAVDRAIILEDDAVPHPTFFRFCEELLERYAEDERVIQIAGHNFQFGNRRGADSYFFSRWNLCSGAWATWRRAWKLQDMTLAAWPELRETTWLEDIHGDRRAAEYWRLIFDRAHREVGRSDYWDFQWTFACWAHHGLTAIPNVTLASNIGFGPGATHTKGPDPRAALPMEAMDFPLRHPAVMVRDLAADRFIFDTCVAPPVPQASLVRRVARRARRLAGKAVGWVRVARRG